MSLTSRDIIKRGMRLIGGLASGDDPSADELNEAFIAFNAMCRGMHGTIIGPRLSPQPLAATGQAENGGLYQCALSTAATLTAPLKPRSGARFGAVDVSNNFSTNNLTINRNNQLLEGAATNLVLSTSLTSRTWFFDGDTGNWIREQDITTIDTSPPYPDRLIAFLPAMFAVYYVAENGGEIRPDTVGMDQLGKESFARNYARRGRNQSDVPIGAQVPTSVASQ